MTAPEVVSRAGAGTWARLDLMPVGIPSDGMTIAVAVVPLHPGRRDLGPQAVLAQAQEAAGWAVGLSVDGRASISVGTTAGPVSLIAGDPLLAGDRAEIVARIPGAPGGRLEIEVTPAEGPARRSSVVLGAPVMPARAALLWGCREVRDGVLPQQQFDGSVSAVAVVADARASIPLDGHPALVAKEQSAVQVGRGDGEGPPPTSS